MIQACIILNLFSGNLSYDCFEEGSKLKKMSYSWIKHVVDEENEC